MGCDNFMSFAKSLSQLEIKDGMGEELFSHVTEGEGGLNKDQFLSFIQLFYRVVKPTVLTETISIKSKTTRRLDAGEMVEGIEEPKKDDSVKVLRVLCRAVQDGMEGWVTIAGNQG